MMVWSCAVPATVGAIGATLAKQVSELLRVALSGGEVGDGCFVDFEHSFGSIHSASQLDSAFGTGLGANKRHVEV